MKAAVIPLSFTNGLKVTALVAIAAFLSACSLHSPTDSLNKAAASITKATSNLTKATDEFGKAADDWLDSVKPFATVATDDKKEPDEKERLESRQFVHFFGSDMSSRLSEVDKRIAYSTQLASLEMAGSGQPLEWVGKGAKIRGQVTPGPIYSVNGDMCRRYKHVINLSGKLRKIQRTACKTGPRGWQVIG